MFNTFNHFFRFLVSVLYSKAKLAAACAGIIYFLTYVPCMYLAVREETAHDKIPFYAKTLASLLSTTAFGMGAKDFESVRQTGRKPLEPRSPRPLALPHSRPSHYFQVVSFSRAASYYYVYYATHTGRGVRRARM